MLGSGLGGGRTAAMLALTAVHDVMKLEALRPTVLPEHAPYQGYAAGDPITDHDAALAYVLEYDTEALPCIAALSPAQQAAVRFTQAELQYNHGWLVQGEAPPGALFSRFKAKLAQSGSASPAADVAFYFVHWLTDLAGAVPAPLRGAEQFASRLPLHVSCSIIGTVHVPMRLADTSETELMEDYLVGTWRERRQILQELPTGPHAIALMRLVAQVRLCNRLHRPHTAHTRRF